MKYGKNQMFLFQRQTQKVKDLVCKLFWSMIFTLVKANKTACKYIFKKCELTVHKKHLVFPPRKTVRIDILHHQIYKTGGVDNPDCLVNHSVLK